MPCGPEKEALALARLEGTGPCNVPRVDGACRSQPRNGREDISQEPSGGVCRRWAVVHHQT